jgi:hypothetical protein
VVTNNIQKGKENDPISRDVLEDPMNMTILHIPLKIKFQYIKISCKIFIRSCYRTLLSKLNSNTDKPSILVGTPGIGKSHFALYFAYSLIKRGIPFLIDTDYNDDGNNFVFFNPNGDIVVSDLNALNLEISKFDFVWLIVDSSVPRINQLYIDSSAKMDQSKGFTKTNFDSLKFYLPCWDLDEIKK